ncbi:DUF4381 family protein [Rhizobium leguminosarum]|uniref:DUF4381 domain-containing protein n=1 Tax=Rhizobium ruizarguesonis TaxID=2081791 RepID=UPI00103ADC68|nr:DUF4381 domain-containing protein [Rhizobium ruizarguesonis]NEI05676.1 DUF4381 family protein [Rhizobium ruizarguesonis]TCA36214.1 DUF4381 domain-containing protein [Rhizobium leguminosarum bv. viciae]
MEPAAKLDPMTEMALRSLYDIAMPAPVSWWPQTWGWAVVAALLAFAALLVILRRIKRYRANAYRREALTLLEGVADKLRHPATRPDAIRELAEVLKRTALGAWPREEVASLSSDGWVRFLDAHEEDGTGDTLERLLDDFEYHGAEIVADLPSNVCGDLVIAARKWIEQHHVSA